MRYKKTVKGETGQVKKYSKWPWSKHMSFLDSTIQYRPHPSNIKQAIGQTNLSPEPTMSQVIEEDESTQSHSQKILHQTKKKKKKLSHSQATNSSNSDVDKVISFLKSKKSKERNIDGVDHLFLSYASTFKTFRPKTQSMLKLKLANIFAETELRELQEQEPTQTT